MDLKSHGIQCRQMNTNPVPIEGGTAMSNIERVGNTNDVPRICGIESKLTRKYHALLNENGTEMLSTSFPGAAEQGNG